MKEIFNLEKVLQNYIDFHYSGKESQSTGYLSWFFLIQHLIGLVMIQDQFGKPVDLISEDKWEMKKGDPKLLSNRDYYKIDFFDFIEYSTSELVDNSKIFDLMPKANIEQKRQIIFIDSINKNTNEPLFDSFLGGFEIDSAFIFPYSSTSVITGLRVKNEKPNIPPYNFPTNFIVITNYVKNEEKKDFIETVQALILENYSKDFPFFFQTDTNAFCKYKINRFGIIKEIDQKDEPEIQFDEGISGVEFYKRLNAYQEYHHNSEIRSAFDTNFQIYFETSRLLLCMPNYIDFMYDLILRERIPVGQKTVKKISKTKQGKRKKKNVIKQIYKIIKSIRVRYLEENRLRTTGIIKERKWTPPKYRYEVRGHWRTLPKSNWQGHDPQGNIILGRTWVHQFFKGKDEQTESVILEKQPNVVIKIKQPLSYGRDVVESSRQKGTLINIENYETLQEIKTDKKPSEEWVYKERQKLTAALRFLIIKGDNFRCQICGANAIEDKNIRLEVDHKIPLIKWGPTEPDNLWTLCSECNRGKATTVLREINS